MRGRQNGYPAFHCVGTASNDDYTNTTANNLWKGECGVNWRIIDDSKRGHNHTS
jgi:hypothetical protein